ILEAAIDDRLGGVELLLGALLLVAPAAARSVLAVARPLAAAPLVAAAALLPFAGGGIAWSALARLARITAGALAGRSRTALAALAPGGPRNRLAGYRFTGGGTRGRGALLRRAVAGWPATTPA